MDEYDQYKSDEIVSLPPFEVNESKIKVEAPSLKVDKPSIKVDIPLNLLNKANPNAEAKRAPLTPWGLHPIERWISNELTSRASEYGANPVEINQGKYSGPRTAWARVFSNGINRNPEFPDAQKMEGFLMGGTHGFEESYGFGGSNNNNKITIGFDAKGNRHVLTEGIKPGFPNRPPPNIISIECDLSGGQNSSFPGLLRRVRVEWKCYSLNQLNYLIPYFLTPRITMVVEWGWNNYNPNSLANLENKTELSAIFNGEYKYTAKKIKDSNGNYDLAMGYITDYGYDLNENGGYNCYTVITNANYLIEGQSYRNKSYYEISESDKATQKSSFIEYVSSIQSLDTPNPDLNAFKEKYKLDPAYVKDRIFSTKGSPYNSPLNNESCWIRMDLVTKIINKFFEIELKKSNVSDGGASNKISELYIEDAIMCGSPSLKSVDKKILFPNQYAPRFLAFKAQTDIERRRNINTQPGTSFGPVGAGGFAGLGQSSQIRTLNQESDLQEAMREQQAINRSTQERIKATSGSGFSETIGNVVSVEYKNLFSSYISEYGLTDSFDDLKSLINPKGESFPVYRPYVQKDENGNDQPGSVPSGYWGYLKDVYVSVDLLKEIVERNYTVLRMLEMLLQRISNAACNISRLKLTSPEYSNGFYTVRDDNMTNIRTAAQAKELLKITLGASHAACIKNAGFSVKMSSDMANQIIFDTAVNGSIVPSDEVSGTYPRLQAPAGPTGSIFSVLDRLFPNATYTKSIPKSRSSPDSKEFNLTRQIGSSVESELVEFQAKDGKKYILFEPNSDFLKKILHDKKDKSATYLNNPIMPGTNFTMELLGISGIRYLSQFTLNLVPDPYTYKRAVWQVTEIKQKIENKNWTTTITAQVRPLSII